MPNMRGEVLTTLEQMQRWRDTKDLRAFARKFRSQNGEDGIIDEICRRLGIEKGYFVEFGAGDGLECNCSHLMVERGWSGTMIEIGDNEYRALRSAYANAPHVRTVHAGVTPENVESLFETSEVPKEFDLLSIDIDGMDYWVWKALERWNPKIVVIEYNASVPPSRLWVMKRDPEWKGWDGSTDQGASLASLVKLGHAKGYELVATDPVGVNAFFVRKDVLDGHREKFTDPALALFYSPPSYGITGWGHPQGHAPFEEI